MAANGPAAKASTSTSDLATKTASTHHLYRIFLLRLHLFRVYLLRILYY
ncbi:hypothetical protein QQI_0949, partial [Clostridioides difficile Y401]